MTKQQWIELEVGDVIVDHKCGDATRTVLTIKRVSGGRTQRGNTRTSITVNNLKERGRTTIIFSTDDTEGGKRFSLHARTQQQQEKRA